MAKVLVADDEAGLRRLACTILERAGHDVRQAEDGLAAYDLVRKLGGALDLVITDIRMPRMTGTELVDRLTAEYPHLKIICMSGYADQMPEHLPAFVRKPFTPASLLSKVENALRECPSGDEPLHGQRPPQGLPNFCHALMGNVAAPQRKIQNT